jgi:hypothetical protein
MKLISKKRAIRQRRAERVQKGPSHDSTWALGIAVNIPVASVVRYYFRNNIFLVSIFEPAVIL